MRPWETSKRQLMADKAATALISVVGVGVLFAVLAILVFLIQSAAPLWLPESLDKARSLGPAAAVSLHDEKAVPIAFMIRNSRPCTVEMLDVESRKPLEIRSISLSANGEPVLSGTPDAETQCQSLGGAKLGVWKSIGEAPETALRVVAFQIRREFLNTQDAARLAPGILQDLDKRGLSATASGVLARSTKHAPVARLSSEISTQMTIPVPSERLSATGGSWELQSLDEAHNLLSLSPSPGNVVWAKAFARESNSLTGATTISEIPLGFELGEGLRNLGWSSSGTLWGFRANGEIVHNADSLPMRLEGFPTIASAHSLVGGSAFFVDSGRGVCGVMDASHKPVGSQGKLLWARDCPASPDNRLAIHPSLRVVVQKSNQTLTAFEGTTGRQMLQTSLSRLGIPPAVDALAFSASGQQLLFLTQAGLWISALSAPHPEASLTAFFRKVAYEGYQGSSFSWQSTSGSEGFQPKFSLVPLIFGTLKACFYAMIFAVPIGVLAAIYSSELLDRKTRNLVKPAVEMMASLPSVVLGFLAAIVVAPWVERNIMGVLLCFICIPALLFFSGNLLSTYSARHISAKGLFAANRLLFVFLGVGLLGFWAFLELGGWVERVAFRGDFKSYLAGGTGVEGVLWGILILPLIWCILWSVRVAGHQKAWRNLVFVMGPLISLGLGFLMGAQGELRESVLGSYAQRNTLVIALCMGFAVIPIIYSISEDALCAVPAGLRAASLACGASVWQTTSRVVVPTAASGIFSACIIGLGRAIGETMIVVMATGNTPVMTLNPFDGLRSLSANIAVEMPEAVQGSTHYHTLFFSALLLFGFTFFLNSLAEWVRNRYRQRSKAL